MSDSDSDSRAWLETPTRYLESREIAFGLGERPRSLYVAMRDGCRLAIDVYLPQAIERGKRQPAQFPTIAIFTPYYRRFRLVSDTDRVDPSPNAGRYRDFFVPRGYAVVVVDVRGTGASFGTRDSFRSPTERQDYHQIIEWIVAEPWSNGRIGATGISYLGAACDFLASTGHPAVKAIAPLFSVWDTYSDHYYPGGILLNKLAKIYDDLMVGLDHDRRDLLANFAYYANPSFAGPQPVDEDLEGTMVEAAVKEHLGNFRMPDFITEFPYRDSALPYDSDFTSASFSPYWYCDGIRADVAILSVSGWMDGAGYTNGAISRFLTLKKNPQHLLIGPWDHGARINVSPWRKEIGPQFPLMAEILRFFDHYLMEADTGLGDEAPIHYFSMHDEVWKSADNWPPTEKSLTVELADGAQGGALAHQNGDGRLVFDTRLSGGTGQHTRYERLAAINNREYYSDWAAQEKDMPRIDFAPLEASMALDGHVIADIWATSSESDAALFAYLSEIETDGSVRYITEGMLRGLHRAESACSDKHQTTWPFRDFSQVAAEPIVPGEPTLFRFALLPTSWMLHKGSHFRLSFAGADADHYRQVPHGRSPRFEILCSGKYMSRITLPVNMTSHLATEKGR